MILRKFKNSHNLGMWCARQCMTQSIRILMWLWNTVRNMQYKYWDDSYPAGQGRRVSSVCCNFFHISVIKTKSLYKAKIIQIHFCLCSCGLQIEWQFQEGNVSFHYWWNKWSQIKVVSNVLLASVQECSL